MTEIQVGDVFKSVTAKDATFTVQYVGSNRVFGTFNGPENDEGAMFLSSLLNPEWWTKVEAEKLPEGVKLWAERIHFTDADGDEIEIWRYVSGDRDVRITGGDVMVPAETFRWIAEKILGDETSSGGE